MRDETAKRMGPTSVHPPGAAGAKEARDVAELYEFGPFRLEPAASKCGMRGASLG
jgi:hypothetical protein